MLTAKTTRSAKPTTKPFRLYDARGLFLLVAPSGGKWWRFRYRFDGKHKSLSLGVYPEVTLREARRTRDTFRVLLTEGIDPSEQRKAERAKQRADAARELADTRFTLDNNGALSFPLGDIRRLSLTPAETVELRVFLDSTKALVQVTPCP